MIILRKAVIYKYFGKLIFERRSRENTFFTWVLWLSMVCSIDFAPQKHPQFHQKGRLSNIKAVVMMMMYYSYAMGMDDAILELKSQGFEIRNDGINYMVAFPPEKSGIWETFLSNHLETGYWNEYLTDSGVVFLFHLEDGIKRYEVYDFIDDEVLSLCEKLCECKFDSLKQMLMENHYYQTILSK